MVSFCLRENISCYSKTFNFFVLYILNFYEIVLNYFNGILTIINQYIHKGTTKENDLTHCDLSKT